MLHMDEKFGPIIKQKMSFPTTELQIKNCTNLPHKDLTYQPFPQQIVFFRMMTTDKTHKNNKTFFDSTAARKHNNYEFHNNRVSKIR